MSMMGQPKPAASLSSGLLARKGQARPAMRPQGFSGFGTIADAIDDLGWNDMGHVEEFETPHDEAPVMPLPRVLREREVLKEEIEKAEAPAVEPEAETAQVALPEPQQAPAPMSVAALSRIGREARAKRPAAAKAAFTLRLDGDRHLRLRLASAVCNRSAQLIVTEALDAFLQSLPEVEELARTLPAQTGKTRGNRD